MTTEMGRNIEYSAGANRYYVVMYWDGVARKFWFDTKLKATRFFNTKRREGIEYVDPHRDITI